MLRTTFLALTVTAGSAIADPYAAPLGSTPAAGDLGHVFFSVCHPTRPGMLEDRIVLAETAFGWHPTDLGTDLAFQTPDQAITVTLDGNVLGETCEMTIAKDVGGDGADLYEDLEAHLSDDRDGELPEAEYTDGGVIWTWERGVPFALSYTETEDSFVISLKAGDI